MELQRILARDSRSANEKAIQLYGKDVLIISSQRLENQTELIVAVDIGLPVADSAPSSDQLPGPLQEEAPAPFVPFSKLFQSASAFAPLSDEEVAPFSGGAAITPDTEQVLPTPAQTAKASAPVVAAQVAPVDVTLAQQNQHDQQRSQEIVSMLRQEMAALRKEFSLSRQMMPWQNGLSLSPAVAPLVQAMSDVGMPAGLRALLTDSIQHLDSEQAAWSVMENLLINALIRPTVAVPESGVHALCGPSGSGKTTMVARLAWAAAQAHGPERQVMISFADQRPGAWAQMQLLAAQSGVACWRAADADMLGTLLDDVGDKTVWIDTCGTDFLSQAQWLMQHHPKVHRHAVLPVDATVSSVQKIFESSHAGWSTLMLTKLDEAAFPWALMKGLTEQAMPVSCMAGHSLITQAPATFDPVHLVKLALLPLRQHNSPTVFSPDVVSSATPNAALPPVAVAKSPRRPRVAVAVPAQKQQAQDDGILIPTLGVAAMSKPRRKSGKVSASKAAHG